MNDGDKTREQLIEELNALRQEVATLRESPAIQRHRQLQEASEERLRQVIQNMPVMMLAYDESLTQIIVWNRECERVTGFSAEEVVGQSTAVQMLYPDADYRRYLREQWQKAGDTYRDMEWQMTCKDGTVKTTSWSNISETFPIPGWGTWAIGVDITARKQAEASLQAANDMLERRVQERTAELAQTNTLLEAEIAERKQFAEALQHSEDQIRRVLENMPVMLLAYDQDADHILVWNRECERVTGYSAAEIVGKSSREVNKLLYPDRESRLDAYRKMMSHADDYRDLEWDWICKDGTRKTIAWSNISARFPISGWATWAIGVDVTERRRSEERVIQLAIEQERVKLLEQFIGNTSHDLKTPLASMRLSLAVLKKSTEEERRLRHLDILNAQVKHLERVLEDLINIVRLDRLAVAVPAMTINLNEMIETLMIEHEALASQKRHTFRFASQDDPLQVRADPEDLGRAISNLITNALNYTPDGGMITVHTYAQNSSAVIEVQDNGIGISKTELPHIFTRFFRADQARSTNTGGMGLGLSIVQKIISAHGGTIDVESQQGEGTLFRITLPLTADS